VEFNDAQRLAIETLDRNVSVSAGAGSGKTRVLVERFCRLVRDGAARPDEILTVTFTEKAAKEMKERIVARFHDWRRETGEERFAAAARDVETAYIGTIHSFATRLLKENAFEAGIDPRFAVLTDAETELLKERVVDSLAAAGFAAGRPEYIDLLVSYDRRTAAGAVKRLYADLARLDRRTPPAATATTAELSEAARAYDATAADILAYQGKTPDKLAACLDDFQAFYPVLRETMTAAVADLEDLGPVEFTRRFDWERYDRMSAAVKFFGGRLGGDEFKALAKEAGESLQAFLDRLLAPLSAHYADCLTALTVEFAREYAAAKHRAGRLDFDDLLLTARRLLIGPGGGPTETAAAYRRRFKYVMIDEFQDTNDLQKGLVEAVCPPERLFTVGDVKQSIYSFIHSDVAVFQRHQRAMAAAGEIVPMADNYRSRPEVIDFVNGLFAELWAEDADLEFEPLGAQGDFFPSDRREVELLWVEPIAGKGPGNISAAELQRAAEARAIAARIRELLGLDGGEPLMVTKKGPGAEAPRPLHAGDILILLRATGNLKIYERALAEAGLDYYVVSGRGFYASREVEDILNLLRVVENPLDDLAMAAVLRSPMAAVNEDTLWRLTRRPGPSPVEPSGAAGKLYFAVERIDENPAIQGVERARLLEFRQTLRELHAIRSESRLTRLIDLAVERTAYDLKLLASPRGKRRYANLRKVAEAARDFGAAGIFQLADFIRHIDRMKVVAGREGEAPAESEESRVVRLMTVHGAKGLQAPVVFVADCSRKLTGGPRQAAFIFDKELGAAAKLRGPLANEWLTPAPFTRAAERAKARDIAEEKRLFYVAATRAEELLVLSGAAVWAGAADKPYSEIPSWMGWIDQALDLDQPPGPDEVVTGAFGARLRCVRGSAAAASGAAVPSLAAGHLETILAGGPLPDEAARPVEGAALDVAAAVAPLPEGAKRPVDLTVSRVLDYLTCPRRYELRWRLGVEEPALEAGVEGRALKGAPSAPDAAALGSAVHEIMAAVDWAGDPAAQAAALIAAVDEGLREAVRGRFGRFFESSWPARIQAGGEWFQEAPFSVELENCSLRGRIDLLFREPGGWVVIDYKTGAGEDAERYAAQVRLYALAVEKALGEAPAEVILVDLGDGRDFTQKVDRATLAEAEQLAARTAESIRSGDFPGLSGDRCHRCGYRSRFCAQMI
jgi:ATP-dependent helicase/nuclease subunit A